MLRYGDDIDYFAESFSELHKLIYIGAIWWVDLTYHDPFISVVQIFFKVPVSSGLLRRSLPHLWKLDCHMVVTAGKVVEPR